MQHQIHITQIRVVRVRVRDRDISSLVNTSLYTNSSPSDGCFLNLWICCASSIILDHHSVFNFRRANISFNLFSSSIVFLPRPLTFITKRIWFCTYTIFIQEKPVSFIILVFYYFVASQSPLSIGIYNYRLILST